MADVEFQDFSMNVKAELNETTLNWLRETCNEIKSQAQRNCQMDDEGKRLKGSYDTVIDEDSGEGKVGNPLESVYWEEWGTGEYAIHNDGRKGWWVYIEGGSGYQGRTNKYSTKEEAEKTAAFIQKKYGLRAVVTNGRKPNYTLEKAFKAVEGKAKNRLATLLKERLGK